jgi:hypothetical protein
MTYKLLLTGLFLFVAVGFFSSAVAQDTQINESTIQQTKAEISAMNHPTGSQIRLLQLEKSISRNIAIGSAIISHLEQTGKNTTALDVLLVELIALKLEVLSLNSSANNSVEFFVAIKHEAIELSKEFKEVANPLLNATDRILLAQKVKEITVVQQKNYAQELKNKIHLYNTQQLNLVLTSVGINNTHTAELLTIIESGNATQADVRSRMRSIIHSLSPQERKNAWFYLKEAELKKNIGVSSKLDKAKVHLNERKNNSYFITNASNYIANLSTKSHLSKLVENRFEERECRLTAISDELDGDTMHLSAKNCLKQHRGRSQ